MRMTVSGAGQSGTIDLDGSLYTKGDHKGDGVVNMRLEGLAGGTTMQFVEKDGTITLYVNGQRTAIPVSQAQSSGDDLTGVMSKLDLEKYVKDVSVSQHEVLNGDSVTKIVGVLDTSSLLGDFGSQASGGAQVPAELQGVIPSIAKDFGDTRVVLFVNDQTHLVQSALVDLDINAQGKSMHLAVDYGLTSVDKPVDFPSS
jgi:hypothetical protein